MNKYYLMRGMLGLFIFIAIAIRGDSSIEPLCVKASASEMGVSHAPVAILIAIEEERNELMSLARYISNDLELSGQCIVTIKQLGSPHNKKEILLLGKENFLFVLYIKQASYCDQALGIEWRLYDTFDASMIRGKKSECLVVTEIDYAHIISDQIWSAIMNETSPFLTQIVACRRELSNNSGDHVTRLYSLHPSGIQSIEPLVRSTMAVSMPRWNPYKKHLYFCQHTPQGMRLMRIDEQKKVSVVIDREGITMPPAISPSGSVVLSLSKGGKNRLCRYWFDEKAQKGKCVTLTPAHMHAVAPVFIDEDRVLFCAINQRRIPAVSCLHLKSGRIERLVSQGSSLSPAYCPINNRIAYTQRVQGVAQLFIKDLSTGETRQITHNKGNKDYCTFSPDGFYIAYTHDLGKTSRIALHHLSTGRDRYITPENEHWSSPAWS